MLRGSVRSCTAAVDQAASRLPLHAGNRAHLQNDRPALAAAGLLTIAPFPSRCGHDRTSGSLPIGQRQWTGRDVTERTDATVTARVLHLHSQSRQATGVEGLSPPPPSLAPVVANLEEWP